MTAHSIALFLFCGLVLLAVREIPHLPRCPFCGKTRIHAGDCPTQRGQ